MQQARQVTNIKQMNLMPQPGKKPGLRQQPVTGLKMAKLSLILIACFLLSLVAVGQYSSLVILNYRLNSAHADVAVLKEVSRDLELEAARLSSAGRIDKIAREKLGMIEPEIGQLIVISAGRETISRLGE